jgi:uncharacterized protein (TIGR02001 family)
MFKTKDFLNVVGAAALATLALTGAARAEDRQFTYSFTIGGTSDYIFRGLSNNQEAPAAQGSVDFGYGIWYGGVWTSSNVDYPGIGKGWEVDVYTGIKPVLGPVTFDFGILGYLFPTANNDVFLPGELGGRDANYLELKAGASMTPIENLSLSLTNYWSPDNQFNTGTTYTIEGGASYTFAAVGMFTPTVSGALGWQKGFDNDYVALGSSFGKDTYTYWNAGLALAVEKFTFDFRYWDTNLDSTGCNDAQFFNCDARFVFSAKVTLP